MLKDQLINFCAAVGSDIKTLFSRNITAGNGLTGGGDLSTDRTITLGTPGSLTSTTTNLVSALSHTHDVAIGSTTTTGLVRFATNAETSSGVSAALAVTPSGLASVMGGALLGVKVFVNSGTYTRTTGTKHILIEAAGGGGAGGSSQGTNATLISAANGGGAGGFASHYMAAPASATVTVGSAGTPGLAGLSAGGSGGTSSFGAFCSATGGVGGAAGPAIAFGVAINSGTGETGAGGGSAGNILQTHGGAGGAGWSIGRYQAFGGKGGDSHYGGGGYAVMGTSSGSAGRAFGSGGSGASCLESIAAGRAGSAGAKGVVIVYEFG